ncbi:hypothetical protein PENTCL1PPCAC_30558 [Pristionchus entomophagus]|uniref:Uncharacterized protein n=1 Tax=Pristionchus entomophagus TaxID=358040 RepID=A0AAV5UPZ5_9BILA|nr:hypothetical protein PENTCL1PPCAC_10679 [Pristionchus entomophagus]GMT08384.1 hypothetical protein PENTCL1PPCAC_30558 [Pristionchus entomophagus]
MHCLSLLLCLLLLLLPLVTDATECYHFGVNMKTLNETKKFNTKEALTDELKRELRAGGKAEYTIQCDTYCVQNITHTDDHIWLIGGCGTFECKEIIDAGVDCLRGSAIEKTHPSLYHYSCCCEGNKCETRAIEYFFAPNNTAFLSKTASQTLPREEIKTVVYVRTGVAALFALAAIATQVREIKDQEEYGRERIANWVSCR